MENLIVFGANLLCLITVALLLVVIVSVASWRTLRQWIKDTRFGLRGCLVLTLQFGIYFFSFAIGAIYLLLDSFELITYVYQPVFGFAVVTTNHPLGKIMVVSGGWILIIWMFLTSIAVLIFLPRLDLSELLADVDYEGSFVDHLTEPINLVMSSSIEILSQAFEHYGKMTERKADVRAFLYFLSPVLVAVIFIIVGNAL